MCRVAGAAITFLTQIFLARWMGASEFGVFVLAFSWCILLSTLSTGGFRIASIRFIGEALAKSDRDYLLGYVRSSRRITTIISLIVIVIGCVALLALDTFGRFQHVTVYAIALLTVPFFALLNLYSSFANAFSRFALSFIPQNIYRPLLFLVVTLIVWQMTRSLDADAAIAANLISFMIVTGVTAVVVSKLLKRETAGAVPRYETRTWIMTAAPLLLVALFTGYFPSLMMILAGPFLPSDQIAVFHACFRIVMLISFGLVAIDAFTGPQLVKLITDKQSDELQRLVNRITRLRFWAALAAVVLLIPAGKPLLGLFGSEFMAGYPVLLILAGSQLIQAGAGPVTRLISLSGHQNSSIRVFATSIVAAGVLTALLAPLFGTAGAAVATLLVTVLWVIWMRVIVASRLQIRPSPF